MNRSTHVGVYGTTEKDKMIIKIAHVQKSRTMV